jgi:hypothetical protein
VRGQIKQRVRGNGRTFYAYEKIRYPFGFYMSLNFLYLEVKRGYLTWIKNIFPLFTTLISVEKELSAKTITITIKIR